MGTLTFPYEVEARRANIMNRGWQPQIKFLTTEKGCTAGNRIIKDAIGSAQQ
jgi:hypothetical protein